MKKLIVALILLFANPAFASDVTLSWDPVVNAVGYKIYSSLDMGVTWDAGIDTAGAATFVVTDVPDTGLVLFRVSAYNDHGEEIRYTAGVFYCGDCRPPSAPSGIGVK